MAAMVVDDEITGGMLLDANYAGPPARLVLGNNLDAAQPFKGELDTLMVQRGVPERVAAFATVRKKTRLMSPEAVHDNDSAWLARMMAPRPVEAKDRAEWETRRLQVRRGVQDALGLLPWPYTKVSRGDQLPLAVREGRKLEYDDWTVQGLAWQTWKGVYAHGLLYLPKKSSPPWPAVLNPHGHFSDGIFAPEVHFRGISLARQGYVALSVQSVHPVDLNLGLSPLSAMTWDNLRALDLLAARPDVDARRIGCTGASGGGQQTLFLMCLDDRLAAAVPVVYPSYFREIMINPDRKPRMASTHCVCNWVPGLLSFTDEPEMAAVFAPRPAEFITTTQDWTARWGQ